MSNSIADTLYLLKSTADEDISYLKTKADRTRQQQKGDTVTYVINRNINFTNICEQHCSFCAFRRDAQEEGSFWLNLEDILAKCQGAIEKNATEICMQGGLNVEAKINGSSLQYYLQLVTGIKNNFPQLHLHAFSPQEVQFIAREDNLTYSDVILALKDHGVGSMPGTAAEVLDDNVRKIICPEKLNSDTWLEIVSTAHRLGMPTTSTMLCGHIETPEQQLSHLSKIRSIQEKALEKNYPARITEFILLPFVGEQAPAPLRNRVGRNQPDLQATLKLTAVARLFLGDVIPNHQPSWVKLGLDGALDALQWGCNDIGGTLMEEHITTMAGAKGGTCLEEDTIQNAISSIDRPYRQRDTLYQVQSE
ncbi:7,8-didemethyl-8-hydroxy-5-deazariboflavin synthase subunit CofH [Geminocystis herdmanii]|uniref:7,8-didemethyl-8-hydroxy-5-deazariboflavin synthase subunit CofH n=1 Tax=Geminocystis herdmanii TaxID=669359 RepID=UPI0003455113|nr:7,8-didemethyl-8-hydroxy-5-deazariboflavin synthase subunit CofH [Geminocystis herdmanii]